MAEYFYNGVQHNETSSVISHINVDVSRHESELREVQIRLSDYETLKNKDIDNDKRITTAEMMLQEIRGRLDRTVTMIHNCGNCGATLEIPENKPIFRCKFCGTVYVIGPVQVTSRY